MESANIAENQNIGGRPTKAEQLEIQNELKKFFERSLSATYTSAKTGINVKTVCKYFNEWYNAMKEIQTEKILDKRRRIRDITLLSYENELDSLIQKKEELEKEMNKDSESGVGVNVAKYNLHLRIISSIIKLRDHINQLRTVDTAKWAVDEQYEDYRERRSEKYEKEYRVKAEADEEMRWSFGA